MTGETESGQAESDLAAGLDTAPAFAWAALLVLAEDFAVPREDDVSWTAPEIDGDSMTMCYPVYSLRVERAVNALRDVGAVSPWRGWTRYRPDHREPGGLTPSAAVAAASHICLGERICDGTVGEAVKSGLLRAILTTLADWYRTNQAPDPAPEPRRGKAPARHVYVGDHQHGQVTHITTDGRRRLVWNADARAFDVQELTWTTTGSWNKKQAYTNVASGWEVPRE